MVKIALAGGWGRKHHLHRLWLQLFAEPVLFLQRSAGRFSTPLSPEVNTKYSCFPDRFVFIRLITMMKYGNVNLERTPPPRI